MSFKPATVENSVGNFKMDANPVTGFEKSVFSNQVRLANEYLVLVLRSLIDYTESLEDRIAELEAGSSDAASASTAQSRKVTKPKVAAATTTEEAV